MYVVCPVADELAVVLLTAVFDSDRRRAKGFSNVQERQLRQCCEWSGHHFDLQQRRGEDPLLLHWRCRCQCLLSKLCEQS